MSRALDGKDTCASQLQIQFEPAALEPMKVRPWSFQEPRSEMGTSVARGALQQPPTDARLATSAVAASQLAHENAALAAANAKLAQENILLRMRNLAVCRPPSRVATLSASSSPSIASSTAIPPDGVSRVPSFETNKDGAEDADEGRDPNCEPARTYSDPSTTMMIRNIPNSYTRDMLVALLDGQGFRSCFNFVYLPVDFKHETGLGYAFVNFVTSERAERFREHFQGFKGWSVASDKVCDVSWSDALQGYEAHVERYRNSPVMHESVADCFRPVIFANGERVPFPAPTRRVRAPRPWSRRQQA